MIRVLIALALVIVSLIGSAQTPDPSTLPLLQLAQLQDVGAFRVPRDADWAFGGRALAFNPSGPSLYLANYHSQVAEITIPAPVQSSVFDELPVASYRQGFADLLGARWNEINSWGVGIGGLLVANDRLYCAAMTFYDANNDQRRTHCSHPLALTPNALTGFSQTWLSDHQSYVSGAMALIPPEWQTRLGGSALVTQCCIPIVSRTSYGPSAIAVNVADLGQPVLSGTPLLYYDGLHQTLGPWENSTSANAVYNQSAEMGGVVIVPGYRSALYFGRIGVGIPCYGTGTSNPSLHGTDVGDGSKYCHDPTDASKGTHAYPYRSQIWAYDLNDFAAVKAGTKQPWDVVPYGVWPLPLPWADISTHIGGVGIDPATLQIYVTQRNVDALGWDAMPAVRVLAVVGVPPPVDPRIAELEARIAAMKAEAQAVLARNKRNRSKLPLWVTDAMNRILEK